MNAQSKGLLITSFGVLFVVPDALFVRLIAADALTIAFWRLFNVGAAIGIYLLITQGPGPFRAVISTGRYGLIYGIATGSSGILFVLAISLTSVANVVFIIASMPVFAALYSRMFLGETITRRMVWTTLAVVAGLGVIAIGSGETEGASWRGDLLALCVSAVYAAGLTAARRVRPVSMVPALPMTYLFFALLILPIAQPLGVQGDQVWLIGVHAGFIVVASVLLAIGPRYITSAEVALLVLGESVLAPLLVWIVLGEDPGAWALVGGAMVLAALFVSNLIVLARGRRKVDVTSTLT